jgi:hypothetical protein
VIRFFSTGRDVEADRIRFNEGLSKVIDQMKAAELEKKSLCEEIGFAEADHQNLKKNFKVSIFLLSFLSYC